LAVGIAGIMGAIVALVTGPFLFDLGDLVSVLASNSDELKQEMYCATSNSDARERFLAVLDGNGLTALEIDFISLYLNNNVLGILFVPTTESAEYVGSYECTECGELCDWMFAPVDMLSSNFDFGVNVFVGSGIITNDGVNFTLNSVSYVDSGDGLTKHALSLCTVDFFYRWLEIGKPRSGSFPTSGTLCNCDSNGLEVVGAQPSAASVDWRNCVAGEWAKSGVAIFATNPNTTLQWFLQNRFTGGAFSETFKTS
jgi:hypothetical protein